YDLHAQIRQAGFTPAQRDSRYRLVRTFDRAYSETELAPTPIPSRLGALTRSDFVPVAMLA
ncbi:MAG: hypothetical protein WAV70_12885, partial [Anaerolineae bacterium]